MLLLKITLLQLTVQFWKKRTNQLTPENARNVCCRRTPRECARDLSRHRDMRRAIIVKNVIKNIIIVKNHKT